ncbi:hypothetical protein GCM10008960_20630 [Deinococcus sedimenti]|uniref:Uncharacterized protein n=1 Tax=Deinococcus sedimenti TaxID=1867090 RepID=A0ABQ2S778_9DEIO|nr:hypothetical protein GCM10008960_20630 [Deinococcus sedimenti]
MPHAWDNIGQVAQQEDRTGAVLDISLVYLDRHDESQGVDEQVTFTTTDFLSAARATGFGRFHRLAVDDRGTGGRCATLTLAD